MGWRAGWFFVVRAVGGGDGVGDGCVLGGGKVCLEGGRERRELNILLVDDGMGE